MPAPKKNSGAKIVEFAPPTTQPETQTVVTTLPDGYQPTPAPEKAPVSFDWDDLPELLPQEYTRATISPRVDIEAETPQLVKARLMQSFDKFRYAEEEAAKAGKDLASKTVKDAVTYAATSVLDCGTEKRAEEFVRIARRYIKFLGNKTFRGAVDVKNPTRVVFRVVPLQTRVVAKSVTPDVEPAAKTETGF